MKQVLSNSMVQMDKKNSTSAYAVLADGNVKLNCLLKKRWCSGLQTVPGLCSRLCLSPQTKATCPSPAVLVLITTSGFCPVMWRRASAQCQ